MVTGADSGAIRLELTIDRAELEQQMNQVFGRTAVGGGPMGPATRVNPREGVKVSPGAGFTQMLGKLGALTGIALGITAIVRSSKIVSTTAGALNTVLGAMIDVFLAPFAKDFANFVKWLAVTGIPFAKAVGAEVKSAISTMLDALGIGNPTEREQRKAQDTVTKKAAKVLLDPLGTTFETFGMEKPGMLQRRVTSAALGSAIGAPFGPPGAAIGGGLGFAAPPFVDLFERMSSDRKVEAHLLQERLESLLTPTSLLFRLSTREQQVRALQAEMRFIAPQIDVNVDISSMREVIEAVGSATDAALRDALSSGPLGG